MKPGVSNLDLTEAEQNNVRAALQYLRTRCGGWMGLAPVLGYQRKTLSEIAHGTTVTPTLAFRIARFSHVTVEDLIAGRFPPEGTCVHCGHDGHEEGR